MTLVVVAVVTLLSLAVMTLFLIQSVKRLKGNVTHLQEQVLPSIARLQVEAETAQRQLEQVSEASQQIRQDTPGRSAKR